MSAWQRLAPCLIALTVTATVIGGMQEAPQTPEVQAETARHQGVWRSVSFRREGKDTPLAIVHSITREVEGDRVVWRRDGKSFSGSTVVLDPSANPRTIDVHADGGPGRDKVVRGIYKLEGEDLTLCTGDPDAPRPTAFRAEAGDRWTLMVFKRERPSVRP